MKKSNHVAYPQFPLYIPSKGRAQYMMTSKALTNMGVRHYVVVEPQDVEPYRDAIDKWELMTDVLVLDMSYKERYELCDNLGLTKSTGPGPARNFIWDHSIKNGFKWHWVMDDNIRGFRRLNNGKRHYMYTPSPWRVMEDFCLRYTNISMAGPNYQMFVTDNTKSPFTTNTRIYSCNLIRNDVPFRWRGRYNEDTILSLDMLKDGWCTVQFNIFMQDKMNTQTMTGGNSGEFYFDEGTFAKSKMQVDVHPDVSRMVWKFGRCHHYVDYSSFKKQKLIRRNNIDIAKENNEYGMQLKKIQPEK